MTEIHMCNSIDLKCPEQANPKRQKVNLWLLPGAGEKEWGVSASKYDFGGEIKMF